MIAALTVVSGACATGGDVERLTAQHDELDQRMDRIQEQLVVIERSIESFNQLMRDVRADLNADFANVKAEIAALESALRGTETQIERMGRTPPAVAVIPGEDSEDGEAAGVDQVTLYNTAITDYQQGRLGLAQQGFQEYLRLFPRGLSAPDAQYWLGMTYYDQEEYEQAITELRQVPSNYPESSKAPLALRKIGDAYRATADVERGQAMYRELIDRYPNSPEAEAARRELGE